MSTYNKWSVDSVPYNYELLSTRKDYQFRFELREGFNEHNRKGICIDEDKYNLVSHLSPDTQTCLECAEELVQFFDNNYGYSSYKSDLKELIPFLEKTKEEDEIEWYKQAIVDLKSQRDRLDKEIHSKEKTLQRLILITRKRKL